MRPGDSKVMVPSKLAFRAVYGMWIGVELAFGIALGSAPIIARKAENPGKERLFVGTPIAFCSTLAPLLWVV